MKKDDVWYDDEDYDDEDGFKPRKDYPLWASMLVAFLGPAFASVAMRDGAVDLRTLFEFFGAGFAGIGALFANKIFKGNR